MARPHRSDSYFMTPLEISRYDGLFANHAHEDGYIHGDTALDLFSKSGLTQKQLSKIWRLSDYPLDKRLDRTEFSIAMHLIECVSQKGLFLPPELPLSLLSFRRQARRPVVPACRPPPAHNEALSKEPVPPTDTSDWAVPIPPVLPTPPNNALDQNELARELESWIQEMDQNIDSYRTTCLAQVEKVNSMCAIKISQLEKKRDDFVAMIEHKAQAWINQQEMRVNNASRSLSEIRGSSSTASSQSTRTSTAGGEPPAELLCPITLQLMVDPVVAMDGHTYERHAIEEHFATCYRSPSRKLFSPLNNVELRSAYLLPNMTVRSLCRIYQPAR